MGEGVFGDDGVNAFTSIRLGILGGVGGRGIRGLKVKFSSDSSSLQMRN